MSPYRRNLRPVCSRNRTPRRGRPAVWPCVGEPRDCPVQCFARPCRAVNPDDHSRRRTCDLRGHAPLPAADAAVAEVMTASKPGTTGVSKTGALRPAHDAVVKFGARLSTESRAGGLAHSYAAVSVIAGCARHPPVRSGWRRWRLAALGGRPAKHGWTPRTLWAPRWEALSPRRSRSSIRPDPVADVDDVYDQ